MSGRSGAGQHCCAGCAAQEAALTRSGGCALQTSLPCIAPHPRPMRLPLSDRPSQPPGSRTILRLPGSLARNRSRGGGRCRRQSRWNPSGRTRCPSRRSPAGRQPADPRFPATPAPAPIPSPLPPRLRQREAGRRAPLAGQGRPPLLLLVQALQSGRSQQTSVPRGAAMQQPLSGRMTMAAQQRGLTGTASARASKTLIVRLECVDQRDLS